MARNGTTRPNPCLDAALAYATDSQRPLHVFPVPPGEKKSYFAKEYDRDGQPWGMTVNPEKIRKYWKDYPEANVGIATGEINSFFVIETDTKEGHPDLAVEGEETLAKLKAENGGEWPDTYRVRSPTGSIHYYFAWPEGDNITIKTCKLKLVDGIDVKANGGMVLAPPSVRSLNDNRRYERYGPVGQKIANPPQWLLDRVVEKDVKREPGNPEAPIGKIRRAVELLSNTGNWSLVDKDGVVHERSGWDGWNDIGMSIYRGAPNDEGFKCFDDLSRKNSAKYNERYTHYKWSHCYTKCPPDKITVATLFALVDYEHPGWQLIWNEENAEELATWEKEHGGDDGDAAVEAAIQEGVRVAAQDRDGLANTQLKDTAPKEQPKEQTSSDQKPDNEKPKPQGIHATPFQWIDPTKIPMRQWLYRPYYIRQFVSLTVSTGGIGKSSLLIAEALAMVSGQDLLTTSTDGELLRVWYWNGEDPADELQRRFAAAIKHYKLNPDDIGDRLFLDSGRKMPIVLAEEGKHGTVIATPVIKDVITTLLENRIDVLMIDPFVSCHRVSENDNNAIERVAKTWSSIAEVANCSIMLAHHTRKTMGGNNVSVDDGRGASALLAAARTARTLNNMTTEEAEKAQINSSKRTFHFRSDIGKANLTQPAECADWFKLVPVDLENNSLMPGTPGGDDIGVVTAWEYPTDDEITTSVADIKRAQDKITDGGPWRRNERTKNKWIGVPIGEALGLDVASKANRQRIEKRIKAWLAMGLLKTDLRRDPDVNRHDPVEFVVVGRPPVAGDELGF